MTALQSFSLFPSSLNLSSASSSSSQIKGPILCSCLPSISVQFRKTRNRTGSRRSNSRDGVDPVRESAFLDENGVVDDMDGYLNYLSLEYDSVWDTKPSWCQPWTITLTGVGIITCSWLILNSIIVTSLVTALIFAWWYIFLYSYPKGYSDMIAERRNKVTNGLEDTYGTETE